MGKATSRIAKHETTFWGRAMIRYLSAEQITNAVWLLMISAALVLSAKSFSDSSRSVCHNCPEKVEHVGSLSKLMK